MTLKLKLSDEDRERLGAPEWLDTDLSVVPVREAMAIEEATGLDYEVAFELMAPAVEMLDETKARVRYKPAGMRIRVWLGLRRAGVDVDFAELDFDYNRFAGAQMVDRTPEGKEEGSPSDEPPTPSTSRSTGRTRSKTSTTST